MNLLNLFKKKAQEPVQEPVKGAFSDYLEDFKASEEAEKYHSHNTMSDKQKDEILDSYFKNAPKLTTLSGKPQNYAMDSNDCGFCKDGLVTAYGRKDDRIFTYYAQHGFLGWQICAIIAQHWLVNLAVSVPVDDAVRPGWKITINKDNELGESEEEQDAGADLYDLTNRKYHGAEKARQFLKKARIFGVGYALFVFDDVNYEEPYNKDGIKPGSFKGVAIVEPYWITPQWMNNALNDPGSPDFYEPEFYYIQGVGKVHKSHIVKVVHDEVADILKPSYYFGGVPLTQQIYERIYAAERVANEAPLLALTKRLLVVPTNLRALAEKPQIMGKLIDMLVNGRDNQGIYFTEEGEKSAVHQVDTSLSDFDQLILTQYQLVACVAKMPAHKLLKTDPKGLNNNGGYTLKDYAQELMSIQENKLRPFVERLNEVALYSDMPELKGAEMVTTFEPVDAPTELEKAQTEQVKVNSDVALVQSGILAPEEVRDILRNDKDSKYAGIAEEMPAQEMPEDLMLPDDQDPTNGGNQGFGGGFGEKSQQGNLLTNESLNPFNQDSAAIDDRWITIHPPHGNKEDRGIPLKIDEGGEIKAGAGGKFTGKKIGEIKKKPANGGNSGATKTGGANTTGTQQQTEPKAQPKKEPKSKAAMKGYMEARNKQGSGFQDMWNRNNEMGNEFNGAVSALKATIKDEIESNKTNADEFIKSVGSAELDTELESIKKEESELEENLKTLNSMAVEVNKAGARVTISLFDKEMTAEKKSEIEKEYQDKRKEYTDLRNSYMDKLSGMQKRKEEIHRKYAAKVSDYLKKNGATGFDVKVSKTTMPKITKTLQETLAGCLSDEWDTGASLEIRKTSRRANFRDNGVIRGTNEIGTMIHEYAHYLEENNPAMLANSIAFLEYRTQGETARKLRDITGINYARDERAKPDKFFSPYCGKIYTSSRFGVVRARASEIMSMGMEELFTNPVGFAKKDPEYFNFVIANMRGLL